MAVLHVYISVGSKACRKSECGTHATATLCRMHLLTCPYHIPCLNTVLTLFVLRLIIAPVRYILSLLVFAFASFAHRFFLQGDAERAAGLSISPLCDRTKAGVLKSQIGFYDVVALPLYRTFVSRFKDASPMLDALMSNYRHWQAVAGDHQTLQMATVGPPTPTSH